MKTNFAGRVAGLILWLAASIGSTAQAQPNLILNSDIETGTTTPDNWSAYVSSGTMTCSWDTALSVSGSHSLKIEAATDGMGQWAQLIQDINDSTVYRFRGHLYSTNTASGAGSAELHWYNDSYAYLGRTLLSATTGSQWQELKNNAVVPPQGATKVYIVLRAYKTGTYYLDDPILMRKDNNLHTLDGQFPFGLYAMPSAELINNGDMEKYISTDTQTPKTWYNGYSVPNCYSWDATLKYSGNRSLAISLSSDGLADWRQPVPNVSDNKQYKFNAMIYASNVAAGSHSAEIHWFDASSNYLGRNTYSASTTGSWCSINQSAITPPTGTASAFLVLRGYKTGSYNFDDISLTPDQTSLQQVQELKDAGFNLLMAPTLLDAMNSVSGFYGSVNVNTTSTYLPTLINQYESKTALRMWHASPDEPAWWVPPTSSDAMADGYSTILTTDDYYDSRPHRVWVNHAPRGTQSNPSDFSLLRPYSQAADIVSMDIYPVGAAYHSNLDNKTISCVGEYVKILYDYVCTDTTGLQDKPIWMVLQGAGHSDLGRVTHAAELHWLDSGSAVKRIDKFYLATTGTWQSINGQDLTPPVDAVSVSIQLRAYSPGTYYYDNVSLVENGTDLIANGNFETENGSTGYPASWGRSMPDGATGTWDTANYVSASHSVKTTVTVNSISSWYQNVNIDAGKTYNFAASIKSSEAGEYARPTWTQTRFMVYDAIINGARGVVYWGCHILPGNCEFWLSLERIAGEIKDLSSELTGNESFRTVTSGSNSIETLLLDTASGLCLVTANKTDQTVSSVNIQISGLPLSQMTEYYLTTPETVSNNTFTKSFAPYEVKIWLLE